MTADHIDSIYPESGVKRTEQLRKVYLVVAANGGIGLALTEHLLDLATVSHVLVTCRPHSDQQALQDLLQRHPGRMTILYLDVSKQASLDEFSRQVADLPWQIDVVIHAAGILHDQGMKPERSLEQCDSRQLMRLFEVNSIGPLMVARALLPLRNRKQPFVFAALSAMVGSIGDNRLGGWYGYRASKAALNQFVKTLANECRLRFPAASIVAIHPGTTDTALSRPFQKNVRPGSLYTPQLTAKRIMAILNGLDARQSGRFFHWDGSEIAW